MGQTYEFKCPGCGYKTDVSGGDDRGAESATTTITCHDCKKLYDVVTATGGEDEAESKWEQTKPSCPESDRHRIEIWRHPGPCPECGRTMERGKPFMTWN